MNLTINYMQKYALYATQPNLLREKRLCLLNILLHIRYYDEYEVHN